MNVRTWEILKFPEWCYMKALYQMHLFSDASTKAYGMVVYFTNYKEESIKHYLNWN